MHPSCNPLNFLSAAKRESTLLITDFDGTLYRGLFPARCRGISNADLAVLLCLLHLDRPLRSVRLLRACRTLWRLDRRFSLAYQAGKLPLSRMESRLINYFARHVLGASIPSRIAMAADLTAGLLYRDAFAVLKFLNGRSGDVLIISKAFDFVLQAAAERLASEIVSRVRWRGVCLKANSSGQLDAGRSLLTADDKAASARQFLQTNPGFVRSIVIGDTEEDIAVYEAVQSQLGVENVMTVSLQAKDKRISAASMCDFSSWGAFGVFLKDISRN